MRKTPELKPKPKIPELKSKTLDLKAPELKTKRRLRFRLRWRRTPKQIAFPERKKTEE